MDSKSKHPKGEEIRVRFAPSPTGFLHVGSARTALFNFLFAKKNDGIFVLRIEDTDKKRTKWEYEKDILNGLKWLGIEWDEGPDVGGRYGPYRQSERDEIYKNYIEKLLNDGKAYYCFCKPEDLENQRQYFLSMGKQPKYCERCKTLPKEIAEKHRKEGKPSVIRFKVEPKKVVFNDLIRGEIEFDMSLEGDFVIAKDLKSPLYNLACVIDDYEMKISHVIRAEDHIPNTPKQILLQEALNFPTPKYAHLPLILGTDKSKLSKRHGATSISEYKKEGYLPEALVNFLVFLGWSSPYNKEFYSLSSLQKDFSLDRIQKSSAIFNIKKLDFFNSHYIRQMPLQKITEWCIPYLMEKGLIDSVEGKEKSLFKVVDTGEYISLDTLQKIVGIYQQRLVKLSEISELVDFFFKKELYYDKDLLKWKDMEDKDVLLALKTLENVLSKIEYWTKEYLTQILLQEAQRFSVDIGKLKGDRGYLLWPLRVALTGKEASASPFEIAEILGKTKTINRIREATEKIKIIGEKANDV